MVLDHLPSGVGRAALGRYRGQPATVQAHVAVRALTCPLDAVARHLPEHGRILDVGCGHGLFGVVAALGAPGRTVVGVDVDRDKIAAARAVADGLDGRLAFEVAVPGQLPEGPWDAVVIVDVLYLLDPAAQRALLERCAAALAPGGVLLVKETAATPRWKARLSSAQETLAVKVLRITEGSGITFLDPAVLGGWLEGAGLQVTAERLDAGRLHPHHLLVGRRPA